MTQTTHLEQAVNEMLAARVERAKGSPNFCTYYAKRTPSIPFHNGWMVTGDKCTGCGKVKA